MRTIMPSRRNLYTGGTLDRAGHHRHDEAWLAQALADTASRFVVFWRGKALLTGLETGAPKAAMLGRPVNGEDATFLGLQNDVPVFAYELAADDEAAGQEAAFAELRGIATLLPADDATILATAKAMLHWQAHTKFCAVCGAAAKPARGGYVMACTQCGTEHFPRTDAAVIMLVTLGERVLLGQSHNFPAGQNFYSALAGFVEPGESLEDAVRREVFEETGVQVAEVQYHSSQPWPFPASLMLGFYAQAQSEAITLDTHEMRAAGWFSRADIANCKALGFNLPPKVSIARLLIDDWMLVGA